MEIRGRLSEPERARVEAWVLPAAEELGLDRVVINVRNSWRLWGLEAGASNHAVWLKRRAIKRNSSHLGFVLCEEVAHLKLGHLGVDDGLCTFHGALLQESFAHWFAYRQVVAEDPQFPGRLTSTPLPAPILDGLLGYRLGGLIGMSAAGNIDAATRLRAWCKSGRVDPGLLALVKRMHGVFETEAEPVAVAQRLAQIYPKADG